MVTPAKGDKRFTDPDWTANPVFDVIKQSYLITSNWLNDLVSGVEGVDPLTKRRVEFFTKMLTDAFSPSNFLISNPAALREAMATNGESLARGMDNFAADLERGGGQLAISQTDLTKFKVGENVATAPGKVVFQNDLIQLLQFSPATEQVYEIPLLIFPPWINKFYILDLRPENSMIRWLSAQGFTVFVTSWVNPDAELADKTFEDYLNEGIYAAVDAVAAADRRRDASTPSATASAAPCSPAPSPTWPRKSDKRIASATFFAAQQDFSEAGDLLLFTNEDWLKDLEKQDGRRRRRAARPGHGRHLQRPARQRPDLVVLREQLPAGQGAKPFDLLFWNSDQTRMPKTLHLYYLRKFYIENAPGEGRSWTSTANTSTSAR